MSTAIPNNRARFTREELAQATGGTWAQGGGDSLDVVGVVTDSRAVVPHNVFVALHGPTFDGHDYVARAATQGASAVIIERGRAAPSGTGVLEVDDTLAALGRLARAHLRRRRSASPLRVAAITGSAGKTTTKDLTSAILGAMGRCHATSGNLNNLIGVPAVALALSDQPYAVFELGMSVPGEIAALSRIVEADVAALLNVGVAHAASFGGSRDQVAEEKGAIFAALAPPGIAVVNVDDDAAMAQLRRCPADRRVGFGTGPTADVRLVHREAVGARGARVTLARKSGSFDVQLAGVGAAAAVDLAAAVAIADATIGRPVPERTIVEAIARWEPVAGRAVVLELTGGILVLDDSYNANPASMRSALATLRELGQSHKGRTIAVLGEMRELGEISHAEHLAVGDELLRLGTDVVIGCGGMIEAALDRAEADGVVVRRTRGPEEAGDALVEMVRAGDVVLFKGSRGAAVERALARLLSKFPPCREADEAG